MKVNKSASTKVSVVNSEANMPAVCGGVPVGWIDNKGEKYTITLKNVLHFPLSPVKKFIVISLISTQQ